MHFLFHKPDLHLAFGVFPVPRLVEHTISGAPEYLHGLRAVFLSDLHLRRRTKQTDIDALTAQLGRIRPDLLLLGGDYAEDAAALKRFFEAFGALSCPLGIYAVPGNNDSELTPDLRRLQRMMVESGVRLLVNECASLHLPGGTLHIGGCDEHKHGHPDTRRLFSGRGGYRILLSHYPVLPDCEADLVLSGHTHGGQFNICGLTPYAIGYEAKYRVRAISGLHRFGRTQMLVSNGVGISRLPLRIGAEPQLHLLNFGR